VRVPPRIFVLSHGLIGCMIAQSVRPGFLAELLKDWPLFLAVIVLVIVASCVMGWLLMRRQLLPGTTAIWGMSPGAAAAMTLMSEAHGADMRLVAVMQYLRVVIVVLISSIVARIWVGPVHTPTAADAWFPPLSWAAFACTMALAVLGSTLGQRLRLPAGALLLPLAVGAVLQGSGVLAIELPRWLLALAYAGLGWAIGLRFTRPILAHAARVLPVITASILVLVCLCGGLAVLLTYAGIDPLTAYLATSPGGADSVAIIAASSNVDVAFVMGLQTARLIIVIVIGPGIARFMSRRAARRMPPS
jgi:membrane AbrB-like protein